MNRDLIIHALVAAEAQLRRTERLARSIGNPQEFQARVPPLIAETRRHLESLVHRINQLEGGTHEHPQNQPHNQPLRSS